MKPIKTLLALPYLRVRPLWQRRLRAPVAFWQQLRLYRRWGFRWWQAAGIAWRFTGQTMRSPR